MDQTPAPPAHCPNGTGGLDATIAALNALDNFEIRLFNPFRHIPGRQSASGWSVI
ncbi:MAG: hypothetical protein WAU53_12870 [Rhodoplanes sp.]